MGMADRSLDRWSDVMVQSTSWSAGRDIWVHAHLQILLWTPSFTICTIVYCKTHRSGERCGFTLVTRLAVWLADNFARITAVRCSLRNLPQMKYWNWPHCKTRSLRKPITLIHAFDSWQKNSTPKVHLPVTWNQQYNLATAFLRLVGLLVFYVECCFLSVMCCNYGQRKLRRESWIELNSAEGRAASDPRRVKQCPYRSCMRPIYLCQMPKLCSRNKKWASFFQKQTDRQSRKAFCYVRVLSSALSRFRSADFGRFSE